MPQNPEGPISKQLVKGKIAFPDGEPMQIAAEALDEYHDLTPEQEKIITAVGETVGAYLKATTGLLKGRLAHLKPIAPVYLSSPGTVLVACCSDGVVVRFEKSRDKTSKEFRVLSSWSNEDVATATHRISERLITCHRSREFTSATEKSGVELKLSKIAGATGHETEIAIVKIGFDAVMESPANLPPPPHKPFCLLSIRNEVNVEMLGALARGPEPGADIKRFLAHGTLKLPVGWDCIQVFPFFDIQHWTQQNAAVWAENDILGSVLAEQLQESRFRSLDPLASARKHLAGMLNEFRNLLDSEPQREEILQIFLRNHPVLLCPQQARMWPKLPLGAKKTDFVFREASNDYLLVELERSTLKLFRADGHPSAELTDARGQIVDWKRYIEDNLGTVQGELGLSGISTNPKGLIVIGRAQSLSDQERRKLVTMENESPRLKIMTYDDIYDSAKAAVENLLGPLMDVVGNTEIYYLSQPDSASAP